MSCPSWRRSRKRSSFDPKVRVVIASTPSYVGSHDPGYDNAVKALAQSFPRKTKPNGKLNVIPGFMGPWGHQGDQRGS